MINWGISAFSHDASLVVEIDGEIVFASHSERFSGQKNEKDLDQKLIDYATTNWGKPNKVYFYERPVNKLTRQLWAGQYYVLKEEQVKHKIWRRIGKEVPIDYVDHHEAHAAGGFFSSQFGEATIIVLDAIGEWDTSTIWAGEDENIFKLHSTRYPNSLGLWYSAMTQRAGLKPNEEEYIFMGMSALGDPSRFYKEIKETFFKNGGVINLRYNLHKGCRWWKPEKDFYYNYDLAAACQKIFEEKLVEFAIFSKNFNKSDNLVLMGGCALNCVANSVLADREIFKNIWIMPNPGDAGSSLGALYAKKGRNIKWPGALIGYNIPGRYPIEDIIQELQTKSIAAVAAGRAEFGPRALGNRSLLADPRGEEVKNQVNQIKHREPFRPFAPAILEEHVDYYFKMPKNHSYSPFMQFTAECKSPNLFPAIVHYDGTSRVQTVNKEDYPDFYNLLSKWYEISGCPMLLNTSLNIKGKPLVNTEQDAKKFENLHKIPVFTGKP